MWLAAAAVGAAAVAFAKIADFAQLGLRRLLGISTAIPWLLAPLGFCAIAWLTRRYFKGAEGSGIPQTIFAIRADSGEIGERFLRPAVVIGRVVLAGAALLCGGSIGREGPTVHVGAVIVHSVSRWMPKGRMPGQRHAMVLAGGAAGVAAAFNTPLAGIVFAIEELSRSFEERASGTTLTTVILAGIVAIALVGDYTYFGQPQVTAHAASITWQVLLIAAMCGLGGGVFSRLTLASVNYLPWGLQRLRMERPALFAGLCGLGVAALGTASGALTYGTGYEEARSILENHAHSVLGIRTGQSRGHVIVLLERDSRGASGAFAIRRSGFRSISRRPPGPVLRGSLRHPWDVRLPRRGDSGPPHLLRHRHGDDRPACHGAAAHDNGGHRHGIVAVGVPTALPIARGSIRHRAANQLTPTLSEVGWIYPRPPRKTSSC